MATYDIIYFRVINFLKIALPFFGVSLIVAMFVLSRDQASQAVLPFDKNEFAEELAKQQINKLYYSGSVLISSSSGYRLSAPELRISTDGTYIFGEGPVEGLTPLGKIYAGKMEIKRKAPKSPMQLWFSDRVLVDYLPEKI